MTLWHPSTGGDGYLAVDGATVQHAGRLSGGMFVNFSKGPLAAGDSDIVENSVLFDLVAAYGLANRFQLGVDLPVFAAQNGTLTEVGMSSLTGAGLGDVRADFKVRLLGETDGAHGGLNVGVALGLIAPTGSKAGLTSSGAWGGRPRVIVEGGDQKKSGALMAGVILRSDAATLGDLTVEHEAELGGGGRYQLTDTFGLVANVLMRKGLSGDGKDMPVEADLGVRYQASPGLNVTLAGGAGLTDGYGTPQFRVLAGVRYSEASMGAGHVVMARDSDGDGIFDASDECPAVAGSSENHGCPDKDSDADTFLDRDDNCPNEAGIAENKGCPDRDGDGDGVVDRLDGCPGQAGVAENKGCPDTDGDSDGVADRIDRCPAQAGVAENAGCPDMDTDGDGVVDRLDLCDAPGPASNDGCPLPDKDGDGIIGDADKCPDEPETFNGVKDDDGCPDKGKVLVVVTADQIEIKEQIQFETKKAKVKKKSFKVLATVAKILVLHPELNRIRIEGHTDDKGDHDKNVALSQERARAVRKHLIEVNGIEADRLAAVGYGPDKPIADNKTSKGRAANRRVAFVIVHVEPEAPAPTPPDAPPATP